MEEQSTIVNTDSSTTITSTSNDIIEKIYVSEKTAFQHATIWMIDYVRNELDEGSWEGAVLNPEPLIIYDMDGKRLFYKFSVEKNGKPVGEITIAASKVLGNSLQDIGDTRPFDKQAIKTQINELVRKKYPGYSVKTITYVCYDYPKIGVKIRIINAKTGDDKDLIFNAGTFSEVTDANIEEKRVTEGLSIYEMIPSTKYADNIVSWGSDQQYVTNLENAITDSGFNAFEPIQEENIRQLNEAGVLHLLRMIRIIS